MDEKLKADLCSFLEKAREDFKGGMVWTNFSNKYFGRGGIGDGVDDQCIRKEIIGTDEYREIQNMKYQLKEQQDPDSELNRKSRAIMNAIDR